jgi:hypothetical protein
MTDDICVKCHISVGLEPGLEWDDEDEKLCHLCEIETLRARVAELERERDNAILERDDSYTYKLRLMQAKKERDELKLEVLAADNAGKLMERDRDRLAAKLEKARAALMYLADVKTGETNPHRREAIAALSALGGAL